MSETLLLSIHNGIMMAMAGDASSNLLEQEIAQLEQNLASRRSELEKQKQSGQTEQIPHEKETLREIVGEKIQTTAPTTPLISTQPPQTPGGPQSVTIEPPSYLSAELKDKVQDLVNIAFTESIDDAIKQAKASNNAALLDAFHDALVDEFYNRLVERGRLKKL